MVDEMIQTPRAMIEMRPLIGAHQARVNITYRAQNADLPDPVDFDATDVDVRRWVTEAVRAGIPGIAADPTADFADFVIDRFEADDVNPLNRLLVRPKTPFGMIRGWCRVPTCRAWVFDNRICAAGHFQDTDR